MDAMRVAAQVLKGVYIKVYSFQGLSSVKVEPFRQD